MKGGGHDGGWSFCGGWLGSPGGLPAGVIKTRCSAEPGVGAGHTRRGCESGDRCGEGGQVAGGLGDLDASSPGRGTRQAREAGRLEIRVGVDDAEVGGQHDRTGPVPDAVTLARPAVMMGPPVVAGCTGRW